MLSLETPIKNLKKVGPTYLKRLNSLGLKTIRDLFFHFPHRYDDFSQITPISFLKKGQTATVQGEVSEIKNIRTFKRRINITEALIKDQTGSIKAIWFNQPYLAETLKKGTQANFSGKVTFAKNTLSLSNPVYEIVRQKETTHTGRLVPVYHETAGLSSRYLRYLIKPLLPLANKIFDFLPDLIKKEYGLIDLNKAIAQIHFPKDQNSAQTARFRLSFDELFLIQLMVLKQKQALAQAQAQAIGFDQKLIQSFVKSLPFKLTNDQRLATWEIFQDIAKSQVMNRLLDGDVGSGKTVVATMAALATAKAGYQTALMAPTEILAKQHFNTLSHLLKKNKLKIALLTSSAQKTNTQKTFNRLQLKKQIKLGKIDIVIGTQALIQKDLSFKQLALAIIDEQHRFGIKQRASLAKNFSHQQYMPHLLSMTATPIPRTLALTIYGDLDISLLKEMPKGRKPVKTKIVLPADRQKTYDFIEEQAKKKKQIFVICPLIDESEKLEVKSVTQEYEKLNKKVFPNLKILMLHGKLKPKEKENIMQDFKNGQADILVSTSVIEVGVDIPRATIMMIEGADRFGLAQLHQFRGRVGRSSDQAYCFLFTDSAATKTSQRLQAILQSHNGFELAEKDLKIRGPGEIFGSRQWGLPDLTMASLSDLKLVQLARQAAAKTLKEKLSTEILADKIKSFQQTIHLE